MRQVGTANLTDNETRAGDRKPIAGLLLEYSALPEFDLAFEKGELRQCS